MKNALGHRFTLSLECGADVALNTVRSFGRAGWVVGEIPPGGITLPLCMVDRFDFSLIGARRFTIQVDGADVEMVERLGQIYTRRDFAANKAKKMAAAVKFSRGAHKSDPPEIVEGDDDSNFRYVSLVMFKGGGREIPEFCIQAPPKTTSSAPPAAAPAQAAAPKPAPAPAARPVSSTPAPETIAGPLTTGKAERHAMEQGLFQATAQGKHATNDDLTRLFTAAKITTGAAKVAFIRQHFGDEYDIRKLDQSQMNAVRSRLDGIIRVAQETERLAAAERQVPFYDGAA